MCIITFLDAEATCTRCYATAFEMAACHAPRSIRQMFFYKAKQEQHLELPNELLGVVFPKPAFFVPVSGLFQLGEYIIVACHFPTFRVDIDQSSRYCVIFKRRGDSDE